MFSHKQSFGDFLAELLTGAVNDPGSRAVAKEFRGKSYAWRGPRSKPPARAGTQRRIEREKREAKHRDQLYDRGTPHQQTTRQLRRQFERGIAKLQRETPVQAAIRRNEEAKAAARAAT